MHEKELKQLIKDGLRLGVLPDRNGCIAPLPRSDIARLLQDRGRIELCAGWLKLFKRTKAFSKYSCYSLKHEFLADMAHPTWSSWYVTEAGFILAALSAGFEVQARPCTRHINIGSTRPTGPRGDMSYQARRRSRIPEALIDLARRVAREEAARVAAQSVF